MAASDISLIQSVFTFLGGGVMVGVGAIAKGWIDNKRIEQVEGPKTAAEAWQMVFQTMQQQVIDLTERVSRLETQLQARDAAIDQRDGVIRRLRSYLSLVISLLHENDIPIPTAPTDMADMEHIAHERRRPVTTVHVVDKDHSDFGVEIQDE